MDAIYIPRLLSLPERQEKIDFSERMAELETLTPVRGWVAVKHCRTYLEVSARAETIVTLTCDRTLQQYNHRLQVDTSEILWLSATAGLESASAPREIELSSEDLTESLPPDGYFDAWGWLYEQLCLAMPLRKISEESADADCNYTDTPTVGDARWAGLADLRDRLANKE